ncbi:MAG: metallophosphoesterase [Fimbriimonadaceae bacterium]|nr:metallophosphoesterase [Chthonomonadaceae bacterium]MCO5296988.1 metallophosphoesterase [Fimbriimonadaceae bacterium]
MKRLVAFVALCSVAACSPAQKWSFVVAGDGRADTRTERPEDKDGINVVIGSEIAQAVLAEKAKFLVWTGDLVSGYVKDPAEAESQLRAWVRMMKPVYDAKIPVLPCRGNHDAGDVDSAAIWNKVFSGERALPMNGPAAEKGLTYYYGKGDVLMIALDQYGARKEEIEQPWLDGVLARYRKPFIFAFSHEPAFMDGAHKDTMDANPVARDRFWNSLIDAGSRVYFGGHDHLYDHMTIVREGSQPGPVLHQVTAGTAGAPFYKKGDYTGKNEGWKLTRVKNITDTYGYVLVTIDGNTATVTFKGRVAPGKYVAMDTFSFTGSRRAGR